MNLSVETKEKYLLITQKQCAEGYYELELGEMVADLRNYPYQIVSRHSDGTVTVLNPQYVDSIEANDRI